MRKNGGWFEYHIIKKDTRFTVERSNIPRQATAERVAGERDIGIERIIALRCAGNCLVKTDCIFWLANLIYAKRQTIAVYRIIAA